MQINGLHRIPIKSDLITWFFFVCITLACLCFATLSLRLPIGGLGARKTAKSEHRWKCYQMLRSETD